MPIIEVEHVTKEFRLGTTRSLRQSLLNGLKRLKGEAIEHRAPFKALDDVHFSIEKGEVLGIIGHNGAGKSTLLKLLANIASPSNGRIAVNGRVAPLIEVGAGLVPDMTGRENIFLNATILGMKKAEIARKLDDIVAFAELEEFIDTPIKRYSSGMQVRLGFSIAASVDSEILIVDEVLAVGDIAFQRKCIARMENIIKDEGRTVLIVGHNIRQLERICSRMLLMRNGKIELDGKPGEVSKLFLDETTLTQAASATKSTAGIKATADTGEVEILSVEMLSARTENGVAIAPLFSDLKIRIRLCAKQAITNAEINIGLHNPEMVFVTKSSTSMLQVPVNLVEGDNVIDVSIDRVPLCPGPYGVGLGVYDWSRRPLWTGVGLRWIAIEPSPEVAPTLPAGTLSFLPCTWAIRAGTALSQEEPTTAFGAQVAH